MRIVSGVTLQHHDRDLGSAGPDVEHLRVLDSAEQRDRVIGEALVRFAEVHRVVLDGVGLRIHDLGFENSTHVLGRRVGRFALRGKSHA